MENEMLAKIYGEFCSLRGEMSEFKQRTLERLCSLERSFRRSSAERTARICQLVSIGTGVAALAGTAYTVVSEIFG